MTNNIASLILCGGRGTRLWPLSTRENPKQYLRIFSDKSLLEETVNRIAKIVPKNNIFLSSDRIIEGYRCVVEPVTRSTAAAIGLGCIAIEKELGDPVIIVETTDHVYKNENACIDNLKLAVEAAKRGGIITIGIKPTYPSTGFGYIQSGEPYLKNIHKIKKFVEKPEKETAKNYIATGDFYWNAGIFVFKSSIMLEEIKRHMPHLYDALQKIKSSSFDETTMKNVFEKLESISIDYGIMEKTEKAFVLKSGMHWDDIGDWLSLERLFEKDDKNNIIKANFLGIDSKNNIVFSDDKKPVAVIGIDDVVIVSTKYGILVCKKSHSQHVKEIAETIEKANNKNK